METQKPGVFTGKEGAITCSEKKVTIIGLTHKPCNPEVKEMQWGVEVKINTVSFKMQNFDTGLETWAVIVETGLSRSYRINMTIPLLRKSNFARLYII